MFLSYEQQKYLGYDMISHQHAYQYKIIDTNFETAGVAQSHSPVGIALAIGIEIIQEYSKRNLNVVANLIRCFQYSAERYGYPINQTIEWNRNYNPDFNKYEKELEKYMILM